MSTSSDDRIIESVRLYRDALADTRTLYMESGELIRGCYGWLGGADHADARSMAQQMGDLHQGFLMKVFAAVVPQTNPRWMQQRQMGRVLLEHIWGKSVMGRQLHEAVDWLIAASSDFQWSDLVRPFAEIPSVRDRWGELETLAMRMATLLTAVDGSMSLADNQNIQSMKEQFDRLRGGAPDHLASEVDTDNARDAISWLRDQAKRLREGSGASDAVSAPPSPAPVIGSGGGQVARSQVARSQISDRAVHQPLPPGVASEQPTDSDHHTEPLDHTESRNQQTPEQRLSDARSKLDQLIGLEGIKDQIETLTNFLKLERLRQAEGLPTTRPSLHMAFVGNPGTGKTTVARIVAEIYGALGILAKGHLVETDRSGLVAEFAGQTGPKTNARIDDALDGVLFVDEAYTLIDQDGQDQYGREAVQTLLKRMEDQRDRLVVILAGYPDEMAQMIRSNPGLSSRVGTTMTFQDYGPEALCRIFELIAVKAKYTLPAESRRRLLRGFAHLHARRDRHFGNGRCSRNSFERSVRRLANRLASVMDINRELLTTLQPEDIEVAGVSQSDLAEMAGRPGSIRVQCDSCDQPSVIDDRQLGHSVRCDKCEAAFDVSWGQPVPGVAAPPQQPSH